MHFPRTMRTPIALTVFGLILAAVGVAMWVLADTGNDAPGSSAEAPPAEDRPASAVDEGSEAPDEAQGRVVDGLVALYDFDEGQGSLVHDLAGAELHLQVPSSAVWEEGRLRLVEPGLIDSVRPATELVRRVVWSNEITIEAWVEPSKLEQTGPARIVTISADIEHRNITLGQESSDVAVRLRTSATNLNGLPESLVSSAEVIRPGPMQLVYTRDADGRAVLYVDGRQVVTGSDDGELAEWEHRFHLGLGDEFGDDGRPWLGAYDLVAIYDRALLAPEVERNREAGRHMYERGGQGPSTAEGGPPAGDQDPRFGPVDLDPWPTDATTGWRGAGLSEEDLVPQEPLVVTEDGAVIEEVDIVAPPGEGLAIEVRANDVTVRNCRLQGGGELSGPIVIEDGFRGLVIEYCELIGHGAQTANLVRGSHMTLRRNHIHNGRNGPRLGANVLIEENYIHGLVVSGGSHNDGMQSGGGCDVIVRGNHIHNEHDQTSALNLGGTWKDPCVTGYVAEGNLLRGGGYALYFAADAATGMVRDNVFTRESRWGPAHPSARADTWEGNRYADGEPVACPAC